MIPDFVVLLHGQNIFRTDDAEFPKPFRVYVQTASRLMHHFDVEFLSFFGQQPIEKNSGGIGMRRILHHTNHAGAIR